MMKSDLRVISIYSRADAIADGALVDLSGYTPDGEEKTLQHQAGISYPVALTVEAFAATIARGGEWKATDEGEELELPAGQDMTGRLWDLLSLLRLAARKGGSQVEFDIAVWDGMKSVTVRLKSVCGPGDNFEPVITVMMPWED
jgi:hypothetical protein